MQNDGNTISDMIQRLTYGRPYIFVIISYRKEKNKLYESIQNICEQRFSMACIRADHILSSGYDLLSKIHQLIERAEVVIAEISEHSPNVFYEVGYARGVQKSPLLLVEKEKEIPTDLKGLEVIEYRENWEGYDDFQKVFTEHLHSRMSYEHALLKDMLEAPQPQPSYIVSSPKYPGVQSRIKGQVYDRRTFGDHLGILGLMSAFGSIFGEPRGIELVSAQHCPPDMLDQDYNFYLIGSRKVNPVSGKMLERLQENQKIVWSFDPYPETQNDEGDWRVALYKTEGENTIPIMGVTEELGEAREKVWISDYGLIVRVPHPMYPGRIVLMIAGAHSLGSGAAGLAATRTALIRNIRKRLPSGTIEDKNKSFWVLVKGEVNREDYLLDEAGVSIEDAGVYEK